MPTSEFVVQDGELFRIVKELKKEELEEVRNAVNDRQREYDQTVADLGNGPTDRENLFELAKRRDEARAALEDSKSDLEVVERVVAESPLATAGQPENESGSDGVDIPVAVAGAEAAY